MTTQNCPICGAACRSWHEPRYDVTYWSGCLHVKNLISIEGIESFEYSAPPEIPTAK